MSSVVKDEELRGDLARLYAPTIYQIYNSMFDLISPITLSEMKSVLEDFAEITSMPTLSFGVREDSEYYYIFYLVYHPFDVNTKSAFKFFRKADSHRHDTESILIRVNKDTDITDIITVSHNLFKVESNSDRKVVIESDGHGIRPYGEDHPIGNYLKYISFSFFDLNMVTPSDWEYMRHKLNGVDMPDEQYDHILRGSPSGRLHNKIGDIWSCPERLFKSMKIVGRL